MLNKSLKAEYETLELDTEFASCIASMIASDELILRVIVEIAKRDRLLLNYGNQGVIDKNKIYGVTKDEIRESIVLGERIAPTGKQKGKLVTAYPAIKKIDSIISFLMGTTIVYYERHPDKTKRYLYTGRALEVMKVLRKKGYLTHEEIFANSVVKK